MKQMTEIENTSEGVVRSRHLAGAFDEEDLGAHPESCDRGRGEWKSEKRVTGPGDRHDH